MMARCPECGHQFETGHAARGRRAAPRPDTPPLIVGDEAAPGRVSGWACWIDANRAANRVDPFTFGPDLAAAARLAKRLGDRERLMAIFAAYLRDQDPWLVRQGHALRLIEARINAYLQPDDGLSEAGRATRVAVRDWLDEERDGRR